jgi:hypothetical protein
MHSDVGKQNTENNTRYIDYQIKHNLAQGPSRTLPTSVLHDDVRKEDNLPSPGMNGTTKSVSANKTTK